MDQWEAVTWYVYRTSLGAVRVVAPRTYYVVTRDKAGKVLSKEAFQRPLVDAELRKTRAGGLRTDETLVATVEGVSRRTVEHLIARHGIDGLKQALADLDVKHKTRAIAENAKYAESAARINKKVDIGPQERHPDLDKPNRVPDFGDLFRQLTAA